MAKPNPSRTSARLLAATEEVESLRADIDSLRVETETLTKGLSATQALLQTRQNQLDHARGMFARLAEVRAAEFVIFQGKGWNDGQQLVVGEVRNFDTVIASLEPQGDQG
jgi:hypothetical protein